MLRNRVFYALLVIAMTVIYIFTNTYYTLTLLGLCLFLPLLSLTLMLFSRRGLTISAEVPVSVEKAEAVFTCRFENSSIFPVARVVFQAGLENQMTGSSLTKKVSTTVGGKKTVTAKLSMKGSKVGTVIISIQRIRVYDAFGLFALRKKDLADQSTVVYPDMRQAEVYMEKPVETMSDGSRYSPDRPGSDVSEIFALREYAPGDEVRRIHWKLSSKIDKTMIRDFSLPLNYSVFLLLELTKGKEDVIDTAVEIYLSISKALLEGGINHNLAWYDAGTETFHVKALDDFEDLEIAAAQVLGSYASSQRGTALDYYAASGYRSQKSTLVYVVSDPDLEKVAELEVSQTMKTIYIFEDGNTQGKETAEQAIQMTPISVSQAAEGVPEIMV